MIQYEVLIVVSHSLSCEIKGQGERNEGRYPIKNERVIYQRLCVKL